MNEIDRIIDELRRAFDGDPWHGPPLTALLDGLSAREAVDRPVESAHTIWEIIRHIDAWMGEALERLRGNFHPEPVDGDWPETGAPEESAWRRQLAHLTNTHERLIEGIEQFRGNHLDEVVGSPLRDKAQGAGTTYYVLLHGLAQHMAYHSGQIALLRKILKEQ